MGEFYHPGEGNKHEFKDLVDEDFEDELVRQFEQEHHEDDEDYDEY